MPVIHPTLPQMASTLPPTPTLITWLMVASVIAYMAELAFGRKQTGTLLAAIVAAGAGMWLLAGVLHVDFPQQPLWNAVPAYTAVAGAVLGAFIWSLTTRRKSSRRRYY